MKVRKQKVVSISEDGLIGIRIMAAMKGVSTRVMVEKILDAVGVDSDLQERIMECQENDLEREENQNGTHRNLNPTDRKMNPTHRNLISNHRKMNSENAENDFKNAESELSGGEFVISKSDKMYKHSYKTKTVLPNSVRSGGQGASPLPVFTTEPYAGIPMVGEGEWKVSDGALFITSGGKKGVLELMDVESEYTHKRIIVSHNGERTEIDLTAKSGRL